MGRDGDPSASETESTDSEAEQTSTDSVEVDYLTATQPIRAWPNALDLKRAFD